MLDGTLVMTGLVGLAMAAFWWLTPRCPECGCLLSIRDSLDPSLRQESIGPRPTSDYQHLLQPEEGDETEEDC